VDNLDFKGENVVLSRVDQLSFLIPNLLKSYRGLVAESLISNLNGFLNEIKQGIAISKEGSSPKSIFGRANLNQLMERWIDPYLAELSDAISEERLCQLGDLKCASIDFKCGGSAKWADSLLDISRKTSLRAELPYNQKVSAELDLIRQFILIVQSVISSEKYRGCKYCFRRIISDKACWLHKAGVPDFYKKAVKVDSYKNQDFGEWVDTWKSKRILLGDCVEVACTNYGGVDAYVPAVLVPSEVYEMLKSFTDLPWSDASELLDSFLKSSAPHVYMRVAGVSDEVDCFEQYVYAIYDNQNLDNRYETSTSALWFLLTVMEAEAWFRAEKVAQFSNVRKKDNTERDREIMRLSAEGYSVRKISEKIYSELGLKVGKTTVSNVLRARAE